MQEREEHAMGHDPGGLHAIATTNFAGPVLDNEYK